jgi:hypothetical protein
MSSNAIPARFVETAIESLYTETCKVAVATMNEYVNATLQKMIAEHRQYQDYISWVLTDELDGVLRKNEGHEHHRNVIAAVALLYKQRCPSTAYHKWSSAEQDAARARALYSNWGEFYHPYAECAALEAAQWMATLGYCMYVDPFQRQGYDGIYLEKAQRARVLGLRAAAHALAIRTVIGTGRKCTESDYCYGFQATERYAELVVAARVKQYTKLAEFA